MDVGLLNRSAGLRSTTGACADRSSGSSSVSPGAKLQICALYCAIIADIFVTSYTDTIKTTEQLTITLLLSLQIFLLLAIILAFFLITTTASPHVKLGLYNRYLRQHRSVFALCGAALLLIGAVAAYRMTLAYAGLSYMQLWGQRGYLALWAVQRVSLLLLQCATVHATARAFSADPGDGLSAAAIDLMAAVRRL